MNDAAGTIQSSQEQTKLVPYLSPLAVWALSVGTAIGWGSLVVTSTSYLSQAGPLGSVLGLLIGFAMMLMVAHHYHVLANRYPSTGGLYNYIKHIFGYDRAFLAAWFLFLTYIAIFWANATSIPLFARYFLKGVFRVGYLYTLFGYDVYLGEAIATLVAIIAVAALCIRSKRATANIMVALVLLFTIGITLVFIVGMAGFGSLGNTMEPAFLPDKSAVRQVMHIAFISPWAFIGFESVSHSAAEYHFEHRNIFRVLVMALVVTTALYLFIIILSTSAYPAGCNSWLDYITNLDQYEGIEGLPTFFAAHYYFGDAGVYVLMASLMALVITSLIGNLRALSRLCYAVAQDGILPERYAELNERQVPVRTILLIVLISLPIPFVGRAAIGWIVDTTTIGATIIYGFASVAVLKIALDEGDRLNRVLGWICMVILVAFLAFLFLPSVFGVNIIETETYVLMTVWAILGLIFFHRVIQKDHARRFGKAIIVWVALLAFIVIMGLTLAERVNELRESVVIEDIVSYMEGTADPETLAIPPRTFMEVQQQNLTKADRLSVMIVAGLFGMGLFVLLFNYSSMRMWEEKATKERDHARTVAFTDPLTGVKSKAAYAESEKTYEAQIKDGTIQDFGIVVCDVNGLKHVNDTLGHKAGDDYIRSACNLLCEFFKHSPVFRVGGDEFVVLLQGRDFDARGEIMDATNAQIEQNLAEGKVVISLGLAEYDRDNDQTFYEVFKRADGLMYDRKMQLKSMGAITRE